MRIRSIKPEFWRSRSISSLAIEDRLLFVGLWSYVDDNGVGIDRLSTVAADLFADDVESDPRETFARVSRGLANLSDAGRIIRYTVENRDLLAIVNWDEHQRIDKPAKARYPLPTRDDAVIRDTLATPSRDLRETPATGTGEQGNRGTGEQTRSADAEPAFEAWWKLYPRKVGKGQARKAYTSALKKADADTLADSAEAYGQKVIGTDPRFIAHPATWLNGERWLDEPDQGETFAGVESWMNHA